jgi:hypothetical protein
MQIARPLGWVALRNRCTNIAIILLQIYRYQEQTISVGYRCKAAWSHKSDSYIAICFRIDRCWYRKAENVVNPTDLKLIYIYIYIYH